jgi:superfamily II DNA or RNA helicase
MSGPYQEEAVSCIRARLQSSDTALCVLPTGTGKTVVFSEVIRQLQKKTLVIAHRKELLDQAKSKIVVAWPDADFG